MEVKRHDRLDYAIRYPKNFDARKKYPLVLYLHGAGGRGRDITVIEHHDFFEDTDDFLEEAVTVIPQCYADTWFDIFEQLQAFAETMAAQEFVDASRVYAVGASMGGYATWQIAMSRPDLFAAILPICGGGMYWNAARLKNMAVWAFHGDADKTVRVEESIKMVEAINKQGGHAKLTVYEGVAHNSWSPTFHNRETWDWLLAQRKDTGTLPRTEFNDTKTYG
jgi:predicted peptidase